MHILPHTLALITTRRCTASCDHCCFGCSPGESDTIPKERLLGLLDEAQNVSRIKVVVFTGGEPFLLSYLDAGIEKAASLGFVTRCVSNGYWATNPKMARRRLGQAVKAGLNELNLSAGVFHSEWIPTQHVINAAIAGVEADLKNVLVTVEHFEDAGDIADHFIEHPVLGDLIRTGRVILQRNIWITAGGSTQLKHDPSNSRLEKSRYTGCQTLLGAIAVTPDLHLVACCGLHINQIPDLTLGSVKDQTLREAIDQAPDDFLKIWLQVDGPERIVAAAREYDPRIAGPLTSSHPCETCHYLYTDQLVREALPAVYRQHEDRVIPLFLAGVASMALTPIDVPGCRIAVVDAK